MSRKRLEDEQVRKIQKNQRSYYVSLPISLVRKYKLQHGQQVVISDAGDGKLIIEDWKPGGK